MASFDLNSANGTFTGYSSSTQYLNWTTYATTWSSNNPARLAPVYRLAPGRLWTNFRERDRWHLGQIRSPRRATGGAVRAILNGTGSRAVRCRAEPHRPRLRPAASRHERNPLNKRALARR
jgi:hypothetical protein